MSTSHPLLPRFLYCLTFTLIVETSSATAHAFADGNLPAPPDRDGSFSESE
jgi:hypothetical protein